MTRAADLTTSTKPDLTTTPTKPDLTTSTPTKPTTRTKRKPGRPKVRHMSWIAESYAALSIGVTEVPSICKRAWVKCDEQRLIRCDEQGRGTNYRGDQCRECIRILEAHARGIIARRRNAP